MSEGSDQIIVISDDMEEQESLSIEQVQSSSSGDVAAAEVDDEMGEAENNNYLQLMVIPEQDREYGCRYCDKKFSNKQALGGHQNAHKVERLMEMNVDHDAGMGFFLPHSPSPYHRHPDFLHYNWNLACICHQPPVHHHYVNIQLPNFGPGSSNAFSEIPPPRPPVINLRNVPEEPNESGLDLSLRLGYDDDV